MAEFLANLVQSIFTPGPTQSLVVATNVSFACLQAILLALLIATYSIHFVILSFLSAGLWWAINWFVKELQASSEEEARAKRSGNTKKDHDEGGADDSGTETERPDGIERSDHIRREDQGLKPANAEARLRKRRSMGSASGDLSTDSEWDKVENEGDEDRSQ